MLRKLSFLFAVVNALTIVLGSMAQASLLNPGDIAIVEAQGSGDSFAWVREGYSGRASFTWTDEGWQAAGGFLGYPTGEQGQNTITAPAEGIPAGTVNTVSLASGLGNGGESVMFYDGTSASAPTTNPGTGLIWGINWGKWRLEERYDSQRQIGPPDGAIGFSTAAPNFGGVIYNGPLTGTQSQLISSIGNPSNWVSYSGNSWTGGNFTVVPEPASIVLARSACSASWPAAVLAVIVGSITVARDFTAAPSARTDLDIRPTRGLRWKPPSPARLRMLTVPTKSSC